MHDVRREDFEGLLGALGERGPVQHGHDVDDLVQIVEQILEHRLETQHEAAATSATTAAVLNSPLAERADDHEDHLHQRQNQRAQSQSAQMASATICKKKTVDQDFNRNSHLLCGDLHRVQHRVPPDRALRIRPVPRAESPGQDHVDEAVHEEKHPQHRETVHNCHKQNKINYPEDGNYNFDYKSGPVGVRNRGRCCCCPCCSNWTGLS